MNSFALSNLCAEAPNTSSVGGLGFGGSTGRLCLLDAGSLAVVAFGGVADLVFAVLASTVDENS